MNKNPSLKSPNPEESDWKKTFLNAFCDYGLLRHKYNQNTGYNWIKIVHFPEWRPQLLS